MSLPAADRLARALDHIHGEALRLAETRLRVHQSEENYPLRLGTLLGHVDAFLELTDLCIVSAREAFHDMARSDTQPCDRCADADAEASS